MFNTRRGLTHRHLRGAPWFLPCLRVLWVVLRPRRLNHNNLRL
ncbi:MAG: hypothetical protein ACO2PN_11005 [Pyrobaculum sp.]